jgi:hypothetical protein
MRSISRTKEDDRKADCEFSEAGLGCPLAYADSKTFGVSHDSVQFLQQLNLLVDEQF